MKKLLFFFSILTLIGWNQTSAQGNMFRHAKHLKHQIISEEIVQATCNNPSPSQVNHTNHFNVPQGNDTCFNYADATHLEVVCSDISDYHNYRQFDMQDNTFYESGWFPSNQFIIIPVTVGHHYENWIRTVTGADSCDWSALWNFDMQPVTPPILCNVASGLTDFNVFPVPGTAGGSVTATFNSTDIGDAYITLNFFDGISEVTVWNNNFATVPVTIGANSIQIPTLQSGVYFVTVQMGNYYLEKLISVQ